MFFFADSDSDSDSENILKIEEAISENNLEFLKNTKIDIDIKTTNNMTFLHFACEKLASIETCKCLLEKGFDINVIDSEFSKETPLHTLCKSNPPFANVKFLLENGADVNAKDVNGTTPFHLICQTNNAKTLIELMLEKKAEINLQNNYGLSAIHYACSSFPSLEKIQTLLENGADINLLTKSLYSPLYFLVHNSKDYSLIEFLLSKGANPNIMNIEGLSPFLLLLQLGLHEDYIFLFLKYGADPSQINPKNWNSVLHQFCVKTNEKSAKIFQILFEKSEFETYDIKNKSGQTPLHFLCEYAGDITLLKFLLEKKCDVNLPDNNNQTPLLIVLNSPLFRPEIAKLLIEYGADVNVKDSFGQTPLLLACRTNHDAELLQKIIDCGADFSVRTETGKSPLQEASFGNTSTECLELLLKHTPQQDIDNEPGERTSLEYALSSYRKEAIIFLYGSWMDFDLSKGFYLDSHSKSLLEHLRSFHFDLKQFLIQQELTDLQISLNEGGLIKLHKDILFPRFDLILLDDPQKETQKRNQFLENLSNVCKDKSREKVMEFFEFVYTGIIENKKFKDCYQFLFDFIQELGIESPKQWIDKKKGRNGIISDFQKLYENDKEKDFSIVVESRDLKVHKVILALRSDLYRAMFLFVRDNSNTVQDYTQRSYFEMTQIIKFLYIDSIDQEFIKNHYSEMEETIDYFQLNPNSMLKWFAWN